MFGFYRVAAAVPVVKVAEPDYNVNQTLALIEQAAAQGAVLAVFPELGLTGYTCADLFHQPTLLTAAVDGLGQIAAATEGLPMVVVVGAPLRHQGRLYNCAVVIQDGTIRGVVPKSYLPTYKEYYEKRWFSSGRTVRDATIAIDHQLVPFGTDLLFVASDEFVLGLEICEDLWALTPPSSFQAMAGATVIANPSASVSHVAKHDYRRTLLASQSGRCVAAYVYASCGVTESTTDVVFGGHAAIAENGSILAENQPYARENQLLMGEVDLQRLGATRLAETVFPEHEAPPFRRVALDAVPQVDQLEREVDPHPFVPHDPTRRDARCREIFQIQTAGLAKRLAHTGARTAVVGISGGLDSTLALLVTVDACRQLGLATEQVAAVTMPGFGTTDRTYRNAVALAGHLGATLVEIDIKPACLQHFADLGHDPAVHDVTYENVQARERTQLLMDLANQRGGLVIGTGDLSEIALGWSTYNGDHMSMYAVNCSVPKTLIRYVIQWVADQNRQDVHDLLLDILDTPISPELLPRGANDAIVQRTEEVIGPYELHDFFLYHLVKYGAPPPKILWLAMRAFEGRYEEAEIRRWLVLFIRRFFTHQFKRSCIPDGPKVGTISLSPRGDWRMPSDASAQSWLDAL